MKYAKNSFYSMKVIFANQLYDYCEDLNEDWSEGQGNNHEASETADRRLTSRCHSWRNESGLEEIAYPRMSEHFMRI